MDSSHVFLIAGEASGDLHASKLVEELSKRRPGIRFSGIGGDRMQQAGVEILHHADQLSFMGFAEVVRHLPYLMRVMGDVRRFLAMFRPALVVLVDYPAFNLRVARAARELGLSVLYYISPQVWAWHEERVRDLAELTDVIACVLPFEEEWYEQKGSEYGLDIDARYVGHPLVDVARARTEAAVLRVEMLLPEGAPLLALLPGSRRQEVTRLLPPMAEAAALLRRKRPELVPVVCAAPAVGDDDYRRLLARSPLQMAPSVPAGEVYAPSEGVHVVRGRTYDILAASRGALVASGTATLEAGLLGTPMVICYRLHPLSWQITRRRVKVPSVGLFNLVADERVFPEVLQYEVTGHNLATALEPLMDDGPERERAAVAMNRVRSLLAEGGAAGKVAGFAEELLVASDAR